MSEKNTFMKISKCSDTVKAEAILKITISEKNAAPLNGSKLLFYIFLFRNRAINKRN